MSNRKPISRNAVFDEHQMFGHLVCRFGDRATHFFQAVVQQALVVRIGQRIVAGGCFSET